ncbi:MAG: competence/damage-inducible protein A [Bacteroidales bacterium]
MKAEIISIGDELLIGQVINTNASWIAEQLNLSGISVYQIVTISDERVHILKTLKEAGDRSDIILITGGLGPTKDDITKETLCEYFETKLSFNEEVFKNIQLLFEKRGYKISELNRKQAEVPEGCIPLPNIHGTAPGMWFEKKNTIYVSMPGVPFEMKALLSDFVIPGLLSRFKTGAIVHKTILTHGLPESLLAKKIEHWEDNLPKHLKLAYLPKPGAVRLRLTGKGNDKSALENEIEEEIRKLQLIIPTEIFGFDNDSLSQKVGQLLREKGMTISTAESCTGGFIAHLITSVAGSSDYFKGSIIAYANEIKEQSLGVKTQTLIDHGAVSEETVLEMVTGIKSRFKTDCAIATSGIAGPGGGTDEKPVGTTWIAISTPFKTFAKVYEFGDNRERNITKAAMTALNLIRKELSS